MKRFSLKSLLALLLVVAVLLSWLSKPVGQYLFERRLASNIEEAGGVVQFQNFPPASRMQTYLHRLRPQLFDRVTSLSLNSVPCTHEHAVEISQLSHVKSIDFTGCKIDRKHLAAIAKLRGLESLLLHGNPTLNDDDMKLLHNLPDLTEVGVDGTDISLLGLRHFFRSSESRKQLPTDQALRAAAPIKMNKACTAVRALRPFNRNSISGLSHQVSLTMFKNPRSECFKMCRILQNSHTIVILQLVENQVTDEFISALEHVHVIEVAVYGTSTENPKLIDRLSRLKHLRKLTYNGRHPGKLDSLCSLTRLTKLNLSTDKPVTLSDLAPLKPLDRLNVLLLRDAEVPSAKIRQLLPTPRHVHLLSEVKAMPDSPRKHEIARMFWGGFGASREEATRFWPDSGQPTTRQ